MIYHHLDLNPLPLLASPPASGAGSFADIVRFIPWQPSAWPDPPSDDGEFVQVLKRIFEQSMLIEIKNVIDDANARNGNVEHRGHVLAISMLCALDAISSYGYGALNGKQMTPFIEAHFPTDYRPFAERVLRLYRHASVHSWNLFEVAITPGNEPVADAGGVVSFGLLNLFDALKIGTVDFLNKLSGDATLQSAARTRYKKLRETARAVPLPIETKALSEAR